MDMDIKYFFFHLGHQIANGTNFVPNIITINEPHQQEFIVNLTEDGQQQLPSEQPPPNIFNEISFHNITNSVLVSTAFVNRFLVTYWYHFH